MSNQKPNRGASPFNVVSNSMKTPCMNCDDRVLGCHQHCEKYQKYKKEMKQRNANMRRNKER